MLPWILGRGLGVAAYLALAGDRAVPAYWIHHPCDRGSAGPRRPACLWAHVYLAAASVVLVAGHVTALALDRYAGVGWTGVLRALGAHGHRADPGRRSAHVALYGLVLVVATAGPGRVASAGRCGSPSTAPPSWSSA